MKLIATYSLKITEKLKEGLDQLTPMQKYELNEKIKNEMKLMVHMSKFNPKEYE